MTEITIWLLYLWSRCYPVTVLSNKGKTRALTLLKMNLWLLYYFISLWALWIMSQEVFNKMQEFTYHLYSKNTKKVGFNNICNQMLWAKMDYIESGQFPPCSVISFMEMTKLTSGDTDSRVLVTVQNQRRLNDLLNDQPASSKHCAKRHLLHLY